MCFQAMCRFNRSLFANVSIIFKAFFDIIQTDSN